MQRLLIAAALLAAAFYAYGEFTGPGGGLKISSSRPSASGGFSGARKTAIGGITGAAAGVGN